MTESVLLALNVMNSHNDNNKKTNTLNNGGAGGPNYNENPILNHNVARVSTAPSILTSNPFEAQQIKIAGHWKVLRKIGSGAFGDIYLGTNLPAWLIDDLF